MTDGASRRLRAVMETSPVAQRAYAVAARTSDGLPVDVAGHRRGGAHGITADTVMYGGSLAKQVIAVLAARQVVAGSLDPDDVLAHHLEELPSWASRVRIRHVVHHTSGLPKDVPRAVELGNADALARLSGSALLADPGATYRYSNLGYICLAEVVSRVARRSLEHQTATVFERFGMTTARLGGPIPDDRVGQARPPRTVGDGGLWLSASDLRRWNDAMNRRALGESVHALAEQPGALDDGTPLDYAWGVRVVDHRGRRTLSHGGSWPTWSAKALRQPATGVSVALLTTADDAEAVSAVALALADAALDAQ